MKPNALKYPFQERPKAVTIENGVWHVPKVDVATAFSFPGWDSSLIFPKLQPVKIEFCSGNGLWIASRAKEEPNVNWVAVEMKFCRIRKIWSKIHNFSLSNLLPVCGEALHLTSHYIPAGSVQEVFINFPDPWPKRRHARFRLIEKGFVQELYRILVGNGTVSIVTDDAVYSKQVIKEVLGNRGFESVYASPYTVNERSDYGSSYFEDLWRSQGKPIFYHLFQKKRIV